MAQKSLLKDMALSFVLSLVVTAFFLFFMGFLLLKTGIPDAVMQKLMLIGYVIAPAAGGFLMGKKRRQNRFLWGLLLGFVYFIVYFLTAMLCMKVDPVDLLWVALPICLGGMAGGMLS